MKRSVGLIGFLVCVLVPVLIQPVYSKPIKGHARYRMADYNEDVADKDELRDKRAKVEKRLQMVLMWRLSEELDLDEDTGARFFPAIKKYERKQREISHRQKELRKELRKALKRNDDEKLGDLLEDLSHIAAERAELREQEYKELKGILSNTQLAKYVLFRRDFERELRHIISESRRRRQRSRGPDHRPPVDEERYN
jgi:hypothetical protein